MRASASIRTTSILLFSVGLLCFSPGKQSVTHSLVVFEGSDWCANCIQLHKKVLSNDSFIDYSREIELSVLRIDFPRKIHLPDSIQEYNQRIAEKYAFNGTFPTLLLLAEPGPSTRELRYRGESATEFISSLQLILNHSK